MKAMKKLEDYIPLYIGCPVSILCDMPDGNYTISGAITKAINEQDICRVQCYNEQRRQIYWLDIDVVTLILRPLESMTEEEKTKAHEIYYTDKIELLAIMDVMHFELCRYLLSKGFDLFGLREAGLAVYEEDLKKKE